MQNATEFRNPLTADEIAELADRGQDVSRFFTRQGKMMPAIKLAQSQQDEVLGRNNFDLA